MTRAALRCGRSLTVWLSAIATTWKPSAAAERIVASTPRSVAHPATSRRAWLEVITGWPCMLNDEHRPSGVSHPPRETIDTVDDGDEVVLRRAPQKALLHVDDQEH